VRYGLCPEIPGCQTQGMGRTRPVCLSNGIEWQGHPGFTSVEDMDALQDFAEDMGSRTHWGTRSAALKAALETEEAKSASYRKS
jgi:hypothetical protein